VTQEYSIKHEKKSSNTSTNSILELPENKKVMLLSSIYSGEDQKVLLKFYDPELKLIYYWKDRTNHKPYCYTKIEYKEKTEEIIEKEPKYKAIQNKKIDLITDKEINVIKIIAPDPLSIGGTNNSIREKLTAWEADIKYHENYLYDNALVPGTYYYRKNDDIFQYKYEIDPQIHDKLT
jgi:DNA polymerase I